MSSGTSFHHKKKNRSWEHEERRYHCVYCNVWLGSDRQSILLHENGKKHKENVETYMLHKRQEKLEKEKSASMLQKSLLQMEAAARQAHANDLPYYHNPTFEGDVQPAAAMAPPSSSLSTAVATSYSNNNNNTHLLSEPKNEKKKWQDRKNQREQDQKMKRPQNHPDDENAHETDEQNNHPYKKLKIEPNQGFYASSSSSSSSEEGEGKKIWLEGVVFGDLLEEDMPVQLWTGPLLSSAAERRLVERDFYWKDALIVAVRHNNNNINNNGVLQQQQDYADRLHVDVAYLASPNDDDSQEKEEETLLKSVPLDRIRILLGNPNDERIPETLEEARLLAMGGEEVVVVEEQQQQQVLGNQQTQDQTATAILMEEATGGLSSWTTVSVKKTTRRHELKEERARMRLKRKEAALMAEKQAKLAEERKMEEAKVANADDSALGAYDVWSRGTKEGYKGVDITTEVKVEVHELGKKLAPQGKAVSFKKPTFKAKAKMQNRRTTSADD